MKLQEIKRFFKLLWVAFAKMFVVAFWSCFLLVPGILVMIYYAFTEIVFFESPDLDLRGVFMISKELACGQKKAILCDLLIAFSVALALSGVVLATIRILGIFLVVPTEIYVALAVVLPLVTFLPTFEILIVKTFMRAKNKKIVQFSSNFSK